MKFIPLFLSTLFFANICFAQLEESVHQSFEIDQYNTIAINLQGDVEVSTWAGNTILTETKVKLYDASPGILNYFVKLGRYEIENTDSNSQVNLSSKDIVRRPIRTKKGECYEEVRVKVFVPDDFEAETETTWIRKTEGSEAIIAKPDTLINSEEVPTVDTVYTVDSLEHKEILKEEIDKN